MEPQRPKFCGPYQAARQVKGRPMCSYTRLACPYGLHACQSCGKGGHGAGDCCFYAAQTEAVPPPQPSPLPPAPAVSTAKSSAFVPIPWPVEPASTAVFVPGFGCKGEGKSANLVFSLPRQVCLLQPMSRLLFSSPAVLPSSKGARPLLPIH